MTTTQQRPSILIVGAGFSGLGVAIRLRQAGIDDFVIIEKAGDVGGTWRDNTYPGCACDVQSHLYSFSFEQNPEWSRMFAQQPEIWDYLRHCVDKYDLRRHIRFRAELTNARFDESSGRWHVRLADGAELTAQALVMATGALSVPAYPRLPGLDAFAGKQFHSQHWDHDYDLTGKRVAVIGTGASAIQFVPQIAGKVARLDLYQRTPPWILSKPDRPMTAKERSLFRRKPSMQRLLRAAIFWYLEARVLGFVRSTWVLRAVELAAKRHLAAQVPDPELRRRLTPDYRLGCKRVLMADDYYPALMRPNVELITDAIREVQADGVVTADGCKRQVDAIILGTGFRATEPVARGVVQGRHGQDLWEAWSSGPEAYLGTSVAGFPNLFMMLGPNTGLGHSSMVLMIESQARYLTDALRCMRRHKLKFVDVLPKVQAGYNRRLQERLKRTVWVAGGCRSWYLDQHGKNVTLWPGSILSFRRRTARFDPSRYECQPEQAAPEAAAALPGRA